jgi:hypothetical protein
MKLLKDPAWSGEPASEQRIAAKLYGQAAYARGRRAEQSKIAAITEPEVLARRWGASRSMFLWWLSWARPVCGRRGGGGGEARAGGGAGGDAVQPGCARQSCRKADSMPASLPALGRKFDDDQTRDMLCRDRSSVCWELGVICYIQGVWDAFLKGGA